MWPVVRGRAPHHIHTLSTHLRVCLPRCISIARFLFCCLLSPMLRCHVRHACCSKLLAFCLLFFTLMMRTEFSRRGTFYSDLVCSSVWNRMKEDRLGFPKEKIALFRLHPYTPIFSMVSSSPAVFLPIAVLHCPPARSPSPPPSLDEQTVPVHCGGEE